MKKILFCAGEGIGNVVQMIPCIRTLKEVLNYNVDFWWIFGSYVPTQKLIPYVDEWILGNQITTINPVDYYGKVATFWSKDYMNVKPLSFIGQLNKEITHPSPNLSEVEMYMNVARELGAAEENLIWHGLCNYNKVEDGYDVVVHDGYNRHSPADWSKKSYPYYKQAVELLRKEGFSICSVGAKEEFIEGTEDKTGLPLLDSLGIIKNSKLLLCNDSGLYHCANALEKANVVIFTYTSTDKNFDPRFHKYTNIMTRDDLKCRPCQNTPRWKECSTFECRDINPNVLVSFIKTIFFIMGLNNG